MNCIEPFIGRMMNVFPVSDYFLIKNYLIQIYKNPSNLKTWYFRYFTLYRSQQQPKYKMKCVLYSRRTIDLHPINVNPQLSHQNSTTRLDCILTSTYPILMRTEYSCNVNLGWHDPRINKRSMRREKEMTIHQTLCSTIVNGFHVSAPRTQLKATQLINRLDCQPRTAFL